MKKVKLSDGRRGKDEAGGVEVTTSKKEEREQKNDLERKRKFSFIAVHLGAGEHSLKRKEAYKSLCDKACSQGLQLLRCGGTASEAVAEVTKILEDSCLVNAGSGSNLTIDKTVECDAGFMDGDGYFGGVGAIPGVRNPILVAKSIAEVHKKEKLFSCGRVPPNFMVGEPAKCWAASQGIQVCDDNNALISKKSVKTYDKYLAQLKSVENEVNDTVGAIAMDNLGQVASAVSSGGNWLKFPGRIGHSPLFGCGCWSSNQSSLSCNAIAVSTSGSGEMLSRVRLPQECAYMANSETNTGLVGCVSSCINKHFIQNTTLDIHSEPRHIGLIALLWDGRHGEFVWGHTSSNFVIAYASSKMRSVKMNFSELDEGLTVGKSLKVEGVLF
ncbi:Threonine aspartase 1 [Orchesella cincta]|uniref:Threonine aspartase 1 n=1 Tax=Orchesella cincta TaxID=48709 RepID=A0A1D2MLZ2_ORCCI|nr:Threonine aspartase 1 [Orchesella cincta]